MGIYIKGMEMPENCGKCFIGDRDLCRKGCPLVPVPPHGRLIDADAAVANQYAGMNWCYDLYDLPDYLADCPTVIPAEEGDG